MATRRRIENGREENQISGLYASVTRRTGSRTGRVTADIITRARKTQVAYL